MTDVAWKNRRPHILVSAIEHVAVLETVKQFTKQGIDVTLLSVTSEGIVEPKSIRQAITPETILVSIMYANNEIGTIQPIREIAKEIRHARKKIKAHIHISIQMQPRQSIICQFVFLRSALIC